MRVDANGTPATSRNDAPARGRVEEPQSRREGRAPAATGATRPWVADTRSPADIATAHYLAGNYEAALASAREARNGDPLSAKAARIIPRALLQLGRIDDAKNESAPSDFAVQAMIEHSTSRREQFNRGDTPANVLWNDGLLGFRNAMHGRDPLSRLNNAGRAEVEMWKLLVDVGHWGRHYSPDKERLASMERRIAVVLFAMRKARTRDELGLDMLISFTKFCSLIQEAEVAVWQRENPGAEAPLARRSER